VNLDHLAESQAWSEVHPADASALELLIVIGKTARSVSEAEALDYVAGYAIGRDFSARDLQLEKDG
jgi:2-keto-4-pentenoate hydratase/2-oxohepta-3-ene-1,7-dioic acid hydratase in catechol pathway